MSRYINVRIDTDSGEAEVVLTKAFHQESTLWQADVLKDCVDNCERLYFEKLVEWREELDRMRQGLPSASGHSVEGE